MDTVPRPDEDTPARPSETEAERRRRLAWEAERIAEADAEIEAGLFVEEADVDAWIDSLGTDDDCHFLNLALAVGRAAKWRRADLFTPPGC